MHNTFLIKRKKQYFFNMKLTLLLFSAAFTFLSFGQNPYIASIEILPQNPSTNDEIFLATQVGTVNQGQYIGSTVDITGNTITVESCYFVGWLTAPQGYFDTINIGYLNSGNYNLIYTAYASSDFSNCNYEDTNGVDTTIFVNQYVSISEPISQVKMQIYPNPSNAGDVWIISQFQITSADLVDLNGNRLSLEGIQSEGKFHVVLKNAVKGIYFLSITIDSGEKIRKRIILL